MDRPRAARTRVRSQESCRIDGMVKYTVRNNKFLKTVYGTDSGCFGVAAYSLGMIM